MAEEPQARAQALSLDDRPSPADRVKLIQEMQQQQEMAGLQEALPPEVAPLPAAPEAAAVKHLSTAFDVAPVRQVSTDIHGAHVRGNDPTLYAKAQVDHSQLFGQDKIELKGNPWKVIDFTPFLPAVFKPQKPMEHYEARVPEQAAKTDQGLLFHVELAPKEGQEPPLRRAVLTNGGGQLAGAECQNPSELTHLLSHAPALAMQIMSSAFGDAKPGAAPAQITNVTRGRRSAFEAVVSRGGESRAVQINNFGRPVPPGVDGLRANLIVSHYLSDRFEAAN